MAYSTPGETRSKVYRYVRERLLAGSPPTIREVQEAFGFRSVESARSHLRALVEEGLLVRLPGQARGYRLPEQSANTIEPTVVVPLLGRIQAGEFSLAVEVPEGNIAVHSRYPRSELFALKVRGRSMRDAGIVPGSILIVHRQETAEPGDIVVALVGDEATVKTFRRRGRKVVLEPANPDYEPIVPDPDDLRILGKVIEVRRYFEDVPVIDVSA